MPWQRVKVGVAFGQLMYYSDIHVDLDDIVVVETKYGPVKGKIVSLEGSVNCNPFEENNQGYRAKKHVLENATKKIYDKENVIMFGSKTVEVQHISSLRTGIFYTDLDLHNNDIVVYEAPSRDGTVAMHVGRVINEDPDVVTAKFYVVDVVDMAQYEARKARIKEAGKLRAKLEAKKKQYQDIELLRLIAASDPETKQMLDKYTSLIEMPVNANSIKPSDKESEPVPTFDLTKNKEVF